MIESEKTLAVMCEKVDTLALVVIDEKRRLNSNLEKIGTRLDDLNSMMGQYRIEANRRPSWGTALAITALTSACCTLLVLLLSR